MLLVCNVIESTELQAMEIEECFVSIINLCTSREIMISNLACACLPPVFSMCCCCTLARFKIWLVSFFGFGMGEERGALEVSCGCIDLGIKIEHS